ncbi:MAG TPA: type II toxin-antitoxin system HicA family toxin [Chloroflexota bacterium]
MSVKRRDLVQYLEENGYRLVREGAKHSIYSNAQRKVAVKRHRQFDRITANEICKDAGLRPHF